MHRRSLLAAGPAAIVIATPTPSSVPGSASGVDIAGTEDESSDGEDPRLPPDPDDPVARAVLGRPSDEAPPHRLRLWNRADERLPLGLEIASGDGTVSFDGRYDLEPDAHVVVVLYGRDRYDARVIVDERVTEEVELEASSFDAPCPVTDLFVLEDGDLEWRTDPDADRCQD